MQGNPHDQEEFEHFDADAVCEACSSVNPAGTLLCKTCGNNLRDQRTRRMHEGGPSEVAEPRIQIGRIVKGVATVAGLIAILWTTFNVSTIESWYTTRIETAEASSEDFAPESYWNSSEATTLNELAEVLDAAPITIEQASAQPAGVSLASLDGVYVLKRNADPMTSVLGSAYVKVESDQIWFVAKLAGGTELRGIAEKSSDTVFQAYHVGILHTDGTYEDSMGFAQLQATGELQCSGLYSDPEMRIDFVAIQTAAATEGVADVSVGESAEPAPAADATETTPADVSETAPQ